MLSVWSSLHFLPVLGPKGQDSNRNPCCLSMARTEAPPGSWADQCTLPSLCSAGTSLSASECRSAAAPPRTCARSAPACCGWLHPERGSPDWPEEQREVDGYQVIKKKNLYFIKGSGLYEVSNVLPKQKFKGATSNLSHRTFQANFPISPHTHATPNIANERVSLEKPAESYILALHTFILMYQLYVKLNAVFCTGFFSLQTLVFSFCAPSQCATANKKSLRSAAQILTGTLTQLKRS